MNGVAHIGDSCAAVRFGNSIDPIVNARCIAIASAIERLAVAGVRDVVPTYNAVTVHFDPLQIDRQRLSAELQSAARQDASAAEMNAHTIEVRVRYGGVEGPDLRDIAKFANCSEEEVVRRHTAVTYRVYMLGFLPGFAYMGTVDTRIAMPRLDAPRVRVPAGSVGIAGQQTGIYPVDSPGGWRIIGRTSTMPFDAAREHPFLFKAGDRVQFVAI